METDRAEVEEWLARAEAQDAEIIASELAFFAELRRRAAARRLAEPALPVADCADSQPERDE